MSIMVSKQMCGCLNVAAMALILAHIMDLKKDITKCCNLLYVL